MPKVTGYIRVSTQGQDTKKNRADILEFANSKKLGPVCWIEEKVGGRVPWKERKLGQAIQSMSKGDRLIVPELSRLGRSTLEVLEILKHTKDNGVDVFSIKEGLSLNGTSMQAKVMSTVLALVAELERDFISLRTKEGLRAARAKGKLIGRPRGPGKSKLDKFDAEIRALLATGSRQTYIAHRYNTTPANLLNWCRKRNVSTKPDIKAKIGGKGVKP